MAEQVHLYLKANGSDVNGESTVTSLGRENSIECMDLEHEVTSARDAASGLAVGRRQYSPLKIRKRIDKASPLIMKAMTKNEAIEGKFKFFRPNPAGDGTTEHFFTIEITGGRIHSHKFFLPDTDEPGSSTLAPMEEVYFVFHQITWTYEPTGATHTDSWSANT